MKIKITLFTVCLFAAGITNAQTNTFPATGNVGIGTLSPASKLDILPANANAITIRPFGTATGSTGQLQFRELAAGGSNYISFKAPNALASNYVLTLPINYGTNGQLLTTNGAGVLSWTTTSAASVSLNNLTATSINQALLPNTNNTRDLGSAARAWRNIYSSGKVGIGIAAPVGRLHLKGNTNVSQFIIDANATQSNTNPLIKLRNSAGVDLLWVHSDDSTNTFVGVNTGRVNVSGGVNGSNNIFIGKDAGFSNTSGFRNTAIGVQALYSNTTGALNTAIGNSALNANTTGESNTAIGLLALSFNTTGIYNTATGRDALRFNVDGSSNVANGYQALSYNSSGSNNNSFGNHSLFSNSTGSFNTALGYYALSDNSTGFGNIGVGHYAMAANVSGSYNTAIGFGAGCLIGQNPSNFTAVGHGAGFVAGNSNEIEIGNTSVGFIAGNVGWSNYSDKRIKDNIQSNVPGLSFITKLNPVTYTLNIHRQNEMCGINDTNEWEGKYDIEKITQTGFLAQEVEQAALACNYDFNGVKAPHGNAKLYSVQYASFVVPLVKAIQELNNENAELKNEIDQIKSVLKQDQQQRLIEIQKLKATLEQNIPNPFNKSTVINYFVPEKFNNAQLKIYSSQGVEMKVYSIKQIGKGELTVEANTLAAGIYTYTLIIDNKAVDVKQMIVTK